MNNNQGGEYTYTCTRCGNEVSSKSRYCMKCGNLNPDHPDNKKYSKLLNKNGMQEYTVGSEGISAPTVNTNIISKSTVQISFGSRMGNFNLCFFINFLIYIGLVGAVIFFFYQIYNGDIQGILASEISAILIILSLAGVSLYALELVYMKMNYPWFLAFIPLVNLYILSDALTEKKILNILVFVPIIGQIYLLYLLYKLGKSFGYSGFLTMLLPFIMFPVIGFGGSAFNKVCYVSGRDSLEKEYVKKKSYLVTCIVMTIISLVLVIYSNTVNIYRGIDKFSSYYMYFASKRVIKRTKLRVDSDNFTCSRNDDVFYFHFKDLSDNFSIPFYVFRDPIEAYVKVVVTPGGEGFLDKYDYYISMTDGRYGYAEINVKDFELKTVTEYTELDPSYKNGVQCDFRMTPY